MSIQWSSLKGPDLSLKTVSKTAISRDECIYVYTKIRHNIYVSKEKPIPRNLKKVATTAS